jgi:hypothetical protein
MRCGRREEQLHLPARDRPAVGGRVPPIEERNSGSALVVVPIADLSDVVALASAGRGVEESTEEELACRPFPLPAAVRDRREVREVASSYGADRTRVREGDPAVLGLNLRPSVEMNTSGLCEGTALVRAKAYRPSISPFSRPLVRSGSTPTSLSTRVPSTSRSRPGACLTGHDRHREPATTHSTNAARIRLLACATNRARAMDPPPRFGLSRHVDPTPPLDAFNERTPHRPPSEPLGTSQLRPQVGSTRRQRADNPHSRSSKAGVTPGLLLVVDSSRQSNAEDLAIVSQCATELEALRGPFRRRRRALDYLRRTCRASSAIVSRVCRSERPYSRRSQRKDSRLVSMRSVAVVRASPSPGRSRSARARRRVRP